MNGEDRKERGKKIANSIKNYRKSGASKNRTVENAQHEITVKHAMNEALKKKSK